MHDAQLRSAIAENMNDVQIIVVHNLYRRHHKFAGLKLERNSNKMTILKVWFSFRNISCLNVAFHFTENFIIFHLELCPI